MATFTTAEKRQIRSYLGYSGGFRDSDYVLESMMDVVANQVDEAAYARDLLTKIAAIDTALGNTGVGGSSATYGAVKKVDEIEFYSPTVGTTTTSSSLSGIKYGEVLIERLRALLGVDLVGRYFRGGAAIQFHFGKGV